MQGEVVRAGCPVLGDPSSDRFDVAEGDQRLDQGVAARKPSPAKQDEGFRCDQAAFQRQSRRLSKLFAVVASGSDFSDPCPQGQR